jgi:hypothetical protein
MAPMTQCDKLLEAAKELDRVRLQLQLERKRQN